MTVTIERGGGRVDARCRAWMLVPALLACGIPAAGHAETWVSLKFRNALPVEYQLDADSLLIEQSRRSLAGKWILASGLHQTGVWQFDCAARSWKARDTFTVHRSGAPPRQVDTAQSWRAAKAESPIGRLLALVCSAPAVDRQWLVEQLGSGVL